MTDTCRKGHPYTPENTGIDRSRNKRYCRICQRTSAKKRRDARQGQPCNNCHRTGIYIGAGGWCITCARRRATGKPLDGPIVRNNPKPRKEQAPRNAASKPPRRPKLPDTWNNPAPPKTPRKQKTPAHHLPEIGPVPPTPETIRTATRNLLRRHNALDLADALGVAL